MTIKLYLLLAHCTARGESSTTNNRNYLSMSQFVFDKRSCFLYFCSHWMRGDDQSMQISMYFIKFWSLSYFLYQQNIARIFQEANTVLNMNWSIKKISLRAELRAPLDFGFEIFHLHWHWHLIIRRFPNKLFAKNILKLSKRRFPENIKEKVIFKHRKIANAVQRHSLLSGHYDCDVLSEISTISQLL